MDDVLTPGRQLLLTDPETGKGDVVTVASRPFHYGGREWVVVDSRSLVCGLVVVDAEYVRAHA